jgi:hypothetical protein
MQSSDLSLFGLGSREKRYNIDYDCNIENSSYIVRKLCLVGLGSREKGYFDYHCDS